MKRFYQWHRKLSYVFAVPLVLWALSGVLHPMMANWFKPEVAKRFIISKPIVLPDDTMPVSEICQGIDRVQMIKLLKINHVPTLLVITPDQEYYFRDVVTGEDVKGAENLYAEQLARDFLDDQESSLVKITRIDDFDSSYSYINRFLPVYRVELDRSDGMQVVVDLRNGKLATYDHGFRRVATKLFSWFHTWSFLGERDSMLRIIVVSVMSFFALVISVTGLVSLFVMRGKRKMPKKRRMHRYTGAVAAIFFLMFALSGFFHVVVKLNYDDSDQWVSKSSIETKILTVELVDYVKLTGKPVVELSLAIIDDKPYFRVRSTGRDAEVRYYKIFNNELLENGDEVYARELATEFSGYNEELITEVEKIDSFRNDYSFIFRRLPVWRVRYAGQEYWQYTVDTRDAHMSMRTSTPRLIEALSFVNFHKFHFLDPLGKNTRDFVILTGVLLILFVSALGFLLMRKKKKAV